MPMTYDQSQSRELGPQSLPSAFMAGNPVTWAITAAASEFYISRNRELEPALDPITAMWHMEVLTNILYIFEKQRNTFLFKLKKKCLFVHSFEKQSQGERSHSSADWLPRYLPGEGQARARIQELGLSFPWVTTMQPLWAIPAASLGVNLIGKLGWRAELWLQVGER